MAFPIEIDATALTSSRFLIPGITGWWETKFVQLLQLDPGKYEFQTSAAGKASWEFEVTAEGKIQYDVAHDVKNPNVPGFLAGQGTSKITFVGYDITLNAVPLKDATLFFMLVDVIGWLRTIESPHTVRLLPGTYQLGLQNGELVGARFEVTLGGKIQYDDALDVSLGNPPGFLSGSGTRTLTLEGYPITLDASPLKDATLFFMLVDMSGWLRTEESPHPVCLMPGTYHLGLMNGAIAGALFEVTLDGKIQYDDALDVSLGHPPGFLSGTGTNTLKLEGYPITLDASPLKGATIYFRLIDISGWLRTAESPQPAHLMPGTYHLGLMNGAIAGALFEVTLEGKIQYDDALDVQREPNDTRPPGYLTGNNTNTLGLEGYPITLDAMPLVGIISSFKLGVGSYPLSTRDLHLVRLMPTHYNLTFIEGMIDETSFEVTLDGTFSYAAEYDATSGGMLQGKDGKTLKILGYSLLVDASELPGVSIMLMPFNIAIDTAASAPQIIPMIPYRDLVLELHGTSPQSAVFDMEWNGIIALLEPYPFVELERRDGHPVIRLTTKILREKRACRPPVEA